MKQKNISSIKRVVFDVGLFVAFFYLPWWVVYFFMIIGMFLFPFYGEAIFFGTLIDLLYGTDVRYGFGAIGLFASLIIFIIVLRVKKAIRN